MMRTVDQEDRYRRALADPPPPGAGLSHRWLLSVANLGRLAGLSPDETARDLHDAIPRKTARDVRCAVQRAFESDFTPNPYQHIPRKPKVAYNRFWSEILERHPDPCVDLWERSPVRLENPDEDTRLALERLYDPDDLLFIGEAKERGIPGVNIRRAADWLEHPGPWPEHIIVNPLTGAEALTKTGAPSYRCDAAVQDHRFAVVEFDNRTLEMQAAFWCDCIARGLPVALVVHSGGKSLHGWIRCGADEVETLFETLIAVGADPMTRNPSRMSRTPGAYRDNGNRQHLLYLNGEVRP